MSEMQEINGVMVFVWAMKRVVQYPDFEKLVRKTEAT